MEQGQAIDRDEFCHRRRSGEDFKWIHDRYRLRYPGARQPKDDGRPLEIHENQIILRFLFWDVGAIPAEYAPTETFYKTSLLAYAPLAHTARLLALQSPTLGRCCGSLFFTGCSAAHFLPSAGKSSTKQAKQNPYRRMGHARAH